MDIKKVMNEAIENGFTFAAPLDIDTMTPMNEIRDMCAVDKCHAYNKNWACPPACGTVDECSKRIKEYTSGIIVQTMAELEDEFDFEGIEELGKKQAKNAVNFTKYLRKNYPDNDILPLSSGGCMFCEKCTYPDAPCRFPDMRISPLEGYGIFVSDLCKKNNVVYNHGKNTLTYIGAFLFK